MLKQKKPFQRVIPINRPITTKDICFYKGREIIIEFPIYDVDDLVKLHLKELTTPLIKKEEYDGPVKDGDYIRYCFRPINYSLDPLKFIDAFKKSDEYEYFKKHFQGMKKGESKIVDISFPKNHRNKILKSKIVTIEAQLTSILNYIEPSDEEIAIHYGYSSIKELKDILKAEANIYNKIEKDFSTAGQIIRFFIEELPEDILTGLVEKYSSIPIKSSKEKKNLELFLKERFILGIVSQNEGINMSVAGYKNEMEIFSKFFRVVQSVYGNHFDNDKLVQLMTTTFQKYNIYRYLIENNQITYVYRELAITEKNLV